LPDLPRSDREATGDDGILAVCGWPVFYQRAVALTRNLQNVMAAQAATQASAQFFECSHPGITSHQTLVDYLSRTEVCLSGRLRGHDEDFASRTFCSMVLLTRLTVAKLQA
jgi:hypothetical protein